MLILYFCQCASPSFSSDLGKLSGERNSERLNCGTSDCGITLSVYLSLSLSSKLEVFIKGRSLTCCQTDVFDAKSTFFARSPYKFSRVCASTCRFAKIFSSPNFRVFSGSLSRKDEIKLSALLGSSDMGYLPGSL